MSLWTKLQKYLPLALVFLAIVVMLLVFFPNAIGSVDEFNYLVIGQRIISGESLIVPLSEPSLAAGLFITDTGFISKYNIGQGIWLTPFIALGKIIPGGEYLAGLVAFGLLILVCALVLKQKKLAPLALFSVLLHPQIIMFTRTLYSELISAVLVTLSAFLLQKRSLLGGIFLGLTLGALVLTRYTLATWAVMIVLYLMWQVYKDRSLLRYLIIVLITLVICASAIAFLNLQLYGGIIKSGYTFSNEESLQLANIVTRLPTYLLATNLIWPGTFILAAVLAVKKRGIYALVTAQYLVFLAIYSVAGGWLFQGKLTDLLTGLRFFLPIIPLATILVCGNYSYFLEKLPRLKQLLSPAKKSVRIGFSLILTACISVLFSLNAEHNKFLNERAEKSAQISEIIKEQKAEYVIGGPEDFILLGVGTHYIDAGYLDRVNKELASNPNRGLIIAVKYSSRTDRPIPDVLNLATSLVRLGKADKVYNSEHLEIYLIDGQQEFLAYRLEH